MPEKLEKRREGASPDTEPRRSNTRHTVSVLRGMPSKVIVAVAALLACASPAALADTNNTIVGADPVGHLAAALPSVVQHCFEWEYSMTSCWKFLVLKATDDMINTAESNDGKPVPLLPGVVLLEADARRQDVENRAVDNELVDSNNVTVEGELDKVLASRTERLLGGRHLSVFLAPGVSVKVSPSMQRQNDVLAADVSVELSPGISVARMKMKDISPVFLLPPLVFMGFMPFALAAIKGVIVKALMINQLAFSSAVWMSLRNMVFGARPIVRYHNHGYRQPVHRRPQPPPPPHFHPHKSAHSHVYHEAAGPDHVADFSSQSFQADDFSAEETHSAPGPPYISHNPHYGPRPGPSKPFHQSRPRPVEDSEDYLPDEDIEESQDSPVRTSIPVRDRLIP